MSRLTLDEFKTATNGRLIAGWLASPSAVAEMTAHARAGRTPIVALDAALPRGARFSNAEKHHAGRMVREKLNELGWKVVGQRNFKNGHVFASGSIYAPIDRSPSPPPQADEFKQRVERAQALVRAASRNDYSVDDFIRDKRAEATKRARKLDR